MKACIFDLDGVIVDTAKYHFLAWKKLAGEMGIELTEQDNERLKGVGRMESLEIILSMGGISKSAEEKVELTEKKNTWFVEFIQAMKKEEIFEGVISLFSELKQNKIKIGLASSSKNAQAVISKLGIADWFEVAVDGTMIKKSKPDPEIFLMAAQQLQVIPEDCIVVEDAEAGVEAAKSAGMKCIGVGNYRQLGKADQVIAHIKELNYHMLINL
ncbi:MAG TPA: beta-phosphoglucomutase [Cyclobacteriaceae bacterium]